jgi:hypothetical protein
MFLSIIKSWLFLLPEKCGVYKEFKETIQGDRRIF